MSDDKVVKLPVVRIERAPDPLAVALGKEKRTPEATYTADAKLEAFTKVLQQIAHGRNDNGRPMASERARQIARETLSEWGIIW